jgi:3-methyladenine DNA glycosylase AlkD
MLDELRRTLRAVSTPERAEGSLRYFKTGPGQYGEGDKFLGAAAPDLRRLARESEALKPADIRALLASEWHEERVLALLILVRQFERGDEAARAKIYDLYLRHTRRINNWDLVDVSAPHIVGAHLAGKSRKPLRQLARSSSLWERRIAIIATQHLIRRGEFSDTLEIARMLLKDPEDLIHKATGWMLREVGDRDRAVLEGSLASHAAAMPRTMLRYALEKFPPPVRTRYMGMRGSGGKSFTE